jgi:circadian clock protein KaiC
MKRVFVWGIRELDRILGDALAPGTSVVIAGNPGAGKTTFAATVCYANALRGHPCVYITFQEPKEKFYLQMKRFSMNFEKLEKKGLFAYARMPTFSGDVIDEVLGSINTFIMKNKAKVVVVDSFTPLTRVAGDQIKARAMLQNYFYNVTETTKGITLLIGEIPIGGEMTALEDAEFVADIVLIMKHHVNRGRLSRILEIRKARGAPITLAELPFSIIGGKGIVIYSSPIPREIKPVSIYKKVEIPWSIFKSLEPLHLGSYVTISLPPEVKLGRRILPLLLHVCHINNLKTLVINYEISPIEFVESAKEVVNTDSFDSYMRERVVVESLNPMILSMEEILFQVIELVEKVKPEVVVFNRSDLVYFAHGISDPEKYFTVLRNMLLYLRSRGILVIDLCVSTDEVVYTRKAALADIVIRIIHEVRDTGKGKDIELYVLLSRNGKTPDIVPMKAIREEIGSYLVNLYKSSKNHEKR